MYSLKRCHCVSTPMQQTFLITSMHTVASGEESSTRACEGEGTGESTGESTGEGEGYGCGLERERDEGDGEGVKMGVGLGDGG